LATAKTLELEGAILKAERAARRVPALKLVGTTDGKGRAKNTGTAYLTQSLSNSSLTPSQQTAISIALTSRGRFVGVQGYAGTGKTFMLEKLRDYAARSGYAVEGIAPSNTATQELDKVLPGAETITRRLNRQSYRPETEDKRSTILVVDESSMLSTSQMRELMEYANAQKFARVLLVGDQKQLNAVGAGSPFAALQRAGMPSAVMDDIQRQRNADALQTVNHAIAGEVRQALTKVNTLVQSDRVTETVAETYLALPKSIRDGTGVIILSNKARHETNAAIRDGLKREGTISGAEYQYRGLDDFRFTRAEKGDASSYSFGDVVMAFKNLPSRGLEAGVPYRVIGQDLSKNALELLDPRSSQSLTLPLKQNDKATGVINAFEPVEKAISAGDKIRFTMTDVDHQITNGLQATVLGIGADAIKVKDTDGQERSIPKTSQAASGIDPAYAQTAHAFQGQTVDRILIGMGSREHLSDQKSFYVSVSRARDAITLVTDDSEKLADRLGQMTGERPEALDALAEKNRGLLKARSNSQSRAQTEPEKTPEQIEYEAHKADLKEREERILASIEKQLEKIRERSGPIL
ncbi:MAG: AAA family ATPase, partial [Pseudomonadota bacterium]